MMRTSLAIIYLLFSSSIEAKKTPHIPEADLERLFADHPHPRVKSSNANPFCAKAVDRLKAGPANIKKVICDGQ